MKLIKLYRRRRAVSPILAAILLIGLAVAAGAVLFVVVLPMITSSGEMKFGETTLSDINADDKYDKLVVTLTNELSDTVAVTNVTLQGRTGAGTWTTFTNDDNTTSNFPFNIATSQSKIGMVFTFNPGAYDEVRIKVEYSVDGVAEDPLFSAAYDIAV
ncbi:MAG: archaellin/type IV pilin N-terminal domain-containing protein [Candidatus Hodarchaeales archaeon]